MKDNVIKKALVIAPIAIATAALSLTAFAAKTYFPAPSAEIVKSDINEDGTFDANDYLAVRDKLIGLDYSSGSADFADANGDGFTDAADFVLLKQKYSHDASENLKDEAEKAGIDYERNGRVLVWYDEFDGDTLDETKWHFYRTMASGRTKYVNDDTTYRVENGCFHMISYYNGDDNQPYTAPEGLVTRNTMNFKYGYAEMRAKLSAKNSTWQSWWLQTSTDYQKCYWFAEIDILEGDDGNVAATIHKWNNHGSGHSHLQPKLHGIDNEYIIPENERGEFHIYGYLWDEEKVEFFVDGISYLTLPIDDSGDWDAYKSTVTDYGNDANTPLPGMEGFHEYAFMIFNNEFVNLGNGGSSEFGNVATPDDMPIEYFIDYVRLWQNPETDGIYTKEVIKGISENLG